MEPGKCTNKKALFLGPEKCNSEPGLGPMPHPLSGQVQSFSEGLKRPDMAKAGRTESWARNDSFERDPDDPADDPEPNGTARIPGGLFLFSFFAFSVSCCYCLRKKKCRGGKKGCERQKYNSVQGVLPIISISVLKLHY